MNVAAVIYTAFVVLSSVAASFTRIRLHNVDMAAVIYTAFVVLSSVAASFTLFIYVNYTVQKLIANK